MQLKDIFSASSDGVSQPSNSTHRFKQKALAASILAALAIIAFIAVEASDTKPARKAPSEAAMITLRPDGTDKDVLIARYDANFLALSRRISEVQREASATETRLRAIIADQKSRLETQTSEVKDLKAIAGRAGLTPRPGETPEETEARIKSLLKANDDAAYISKLSSQFGSKTPGKVFHTDPARNTNEPASSIVPALPDISGGVKVPDEAHAAARQAVSGPRLAMVTLPPPAPPTSPAPSVGPSPTLTPDTPLQVNRAAGTTVEDYLPAGSFVRGRLETPSKEAMEEVASTKARRKKEVHLGSPWNAALTFKKKSGRLPPRKKVALTPNFRQIQVTREEPRKKDERYDQYCRATFQISRSMARLPDHFFQDSSLARRWQEDSNS